MLLVFGCTDPLDIEPVPPMAVPIDVSIQILENYLGTCDNSDGNTEQVVVNWLVNALDGVTGRPREFRSGSYTRDNNDSAGNNSLSGVVQAPNMGTWSLQLDINVTCSTCCGTEVSDAQFPFFACGSIANGQSDESIDDGRGLPKFSAFVAMINQNNPPSPIVVNNVMLFSCLNCNQCIL